MLIDTHAHVNFRAFRDEEERVIKRALEQNVWMINVGSQIGTSQRALEMAQKYPEGVFAAVGLHPAHLQSGEVEAYADEFEEVTFQSRFEEFDVKAYKELAQNEKVVAVGEAGLDYYRIDKNNAELIKKQKEVFEKQIELALELNKPVLIHCREAHNDVLEILKKYQGKLSGVIHSFSGRWSQAEQYLATGFYLGFNGIITFARDYDRVVREMPLEKLLLETDCPYLTPIPYRGQRNEPAYVKFVAQKIAELRGIAFDELTEQTTQNAKKLFNI